MSLGSRRRVEVSFLLGLIGAVLACETWRIWPQGIPLAASALVLGMAAVGTSLRLRIAWLFAMLFFSAVVALSAALLWKIAPEAVKNLHGPDIGPLGGLILVVLGIFSFVLGVACLRGAITAVRVWRQEELRGRSNWLVLLVVVALLSTVAWSSGFQYLYRSLWAQHACRQGIVPACISLASNARFDAEERRDFARQACDLGDRHGCTLSLGEAAGGDGNAAAEQLCIQGDTAICRAVGEARLQNGDEAAAKHFFELACRQHRAACGQSANFAAHLGKRELHESLARRGCDLDDGTSCIAILRHFAADLGDEDRAALQLKACLLTDVSECRALIDSNLESYCPIICESGEGNRAQSCYFCGVEARETGKQDLATEWFDKSCSNGFLLACEALGQEAVESKASTTRAETVGEADAAEAFLSVRRDPGSGTSAWVVDEPRLTTAGHGFLARIEQVCQFDPKTDRWRTLPGHPAGPRAIEPAGKSVGSAGRILQTFSAEPGLYWVRWTEQATPSDSRPETIESPAGLREAVEVGYSSWVTVGRVLCNDILIAPSVANATPGRVARCVPFADHAEARMVPDPRKTCARR